jgi:uncharacterized damage-inducible protein DinB
MTTKELFISLFENETKANVRAFSALPTEPSKLLYKPHPDSRTASEIINHIGHRAAEMLMGLAEGKIEFKDAGGYYGIEKQTPNWKGFKTGEEATKDFESNAAKVIAELKKLSDKDWENKVIPLLSQGVKVYEAPIVHMFWALLNETIHHRGQLSTYYRAMGVRPPNIYGPTFEDVQEMLASKKI